MPDTLDALKTLIASEGWQAFTDHARRQWSDEFVVSRIENAVSGIVAGDEPSQNETVRNLLASRKAVIQLLEWPQQQIHVLSQHQPPTGRETVVERFKRSVGR